MSEGGREDLCVQLRPNTLATIRFKHHHLRSRCCIPGHEFEFEAAKSHNKCGPYSDPMKDGTMIGGATKLLLEARWIDWREGRPGFSLVLTIEMNHGFQRIVTTN